MVKVTVLRYNKGDDHREVKEYEQAHSFGLDYGPSRDGCCGSPVLNISDADGRTVAAFNSWDSVEVV